LRVQEKLKSKKKAYAEVTEDTEFAEKKRQTEKQNREKREHVALERKSPPFIPKKHRDGTEVAENAKDGAPSSSSVERRQRGKLKSTVPSKLGASKSDCATG
jgi:hypothetical protein